MTVELRRKDWVVFAVTLGMNALSVWLGARWHPVNEPQGFPVFLGPMIKVTILEPVGWLILAAFIVGYAFLATEIITRCLDAVKPTWPH